MARKIINLIGQRFGRLIVLRDSGKRYQKTRMVWLCKCDCGTIIYVRSNHLQDESVKSCGCFQKEKAAELARKLGKERFIHGEWGTKLYWVWVEMNARCSNSNHKSYKYYDGRGISVCAEWESDYLAFKTWALIHGYQENLTIDRINNDGNYEPSNCRFITREENNKNRKRRN